jgi:glutathione S-transferase
MMATVLRIMPPLVTDPRLVSYVERCTARPAFQRALDAQLGDFEEAA